MRHMHRLVIKKTKWLSKLITDSNEVTHVEPRDIQEDLHYRMMDCLGRHPSYIRPPHSGVSAPATHANHLTTERQTEHVPLPDYISLQNKGTS